MTLNLFKTHTNPDNLSDNISIILQWNMSDILVICKNWVRINGCFWMGINQHGISHANQTKPWTLYPSKQGSFIIISEFPGVGLMERRASSLTSCKVRENRPALGTGSRKQCCHHTTESCNRGQRSEQMMRGNRPLIWVRNTFLWKNTVEALETIKSKMEKNDVFLFVATTV